MMRALNSSRAAAAGADHDLPFARDVPTQYDAEADDIIAASEDALALRFAERHACSLRYVAPWGKWLVWDGRRWRLDDTLRAFDNARRICREAAGEANEPRVQTVLASAKTVAAVERLARADRRLAATIDQWDADPWLLNTPNGIVDLRTGKNRSARMDDYCTKITAVAPGSDCPNWRSFLQRVTGNDDALIAFLQRVCGYALTGITREHALFFLYGTGANGKSVFISTVAGILADYHTTAPIETFTASKSERHPTDLAGLRGARLVAATETEEGKPWAESKIKALTGGDRIAARFMRQDFFEFVPAFKLLIAGNHKPGLRSIDEAIRRRLHLIPFSVTIPAAERDHGLTEALKAEWPGILRWMIEGCLDWQKTGLQPPQVVTDATAAYLEAEDAFAAWIDDCCVRDPQAWAASEDLFASWSKWAIKAGEPVGARKGFASNWKSAVSSRNGETTNAAFSALKFELEGRDACDAKSSYRRHARADGPYKRTRHTRHLPCQEAHEKETTMTSQARIVDPGVRKKSEATP